MRWQPRKFRLQPDQRRRIAKIGLVAVVAALMTACGGTPSAGVPSPGPSLRPTPSASAPEQPTPSPSPSSPAVSATFTGKVVNQPAARLRFGPGLDMPVADLITAGTVLTFDGWYRRADDAPLPDDTTGRIEAWSRDWLHLADGRGWIHSSTVVGQPPADLPPTAWMRPSQLPPPTAGIIPAPLDLQDSSVTCEIASLKMALGARGISRGEVALLDSVGIDPRRPQLDENGRVLRWGNPNAAFVGDPNGRMANLTGYGVYAGPIAKAALYAGASVLAAGRGISPATVYADVIAGHPVIAWVTSDYRNDAVRTWTAWDGSAVTYSLREHAVLIVGVTPSDVLINDPWWGTIWRARGVFEASYATLGEMAVVIR